ncbi:MAG: ATP-binding protein [Coprothermobacterota bacterium]|nr:ATP-binding protein [Coprothermobacterota bacterium]
MNKNYSTRFRYLPRWITPVLQQASQDHSVVVLTGARQVGKSTLLKHEEPFRRWRYWNLDDLDTLAQARTDPGSLWADADAIVLDEAQKAPSVFSAIKLAVDQQPDRRFILSGSANWLLLSRLSESLAGRAVYFVLDPLTHGELQMHPPSDVLWRALHGEWPSDATVESPPDPTSLMAGGGMPALLRFSSEESKMQWWDGYVSTYLERDLRQISQIANLVDFRRFMQLLALRSGQILNQSGLARDAQLKQPTAHRYLNLLEATYLVERLPAFASSHSTRLMKSPKVFWREVGLALFLSGYFTRESLNHAKEWGNFFETFLYHQLRVLVSLWTPPGRLFTWRQRSGMEVDFILEHGRQILAIELKATDRPSFRDTAGIRVFLQEVPHAAGGILLHGGKEIRRFAQNIVALPWNLVTG